jgi:hypothetical protein
MGSATRDGERAGMKEPTHVTLAELLGVLSQATDVGWGIA